MPKVYKKKTPAWVKTVYDSTSCREPDISKYDTEKEAQMFVKTCLTWGVGIVSCEIIPKEQALRERRRRFMSEQI